MEVRPKCVEIQSVEIFVCLCCCFVLFWLYNPIGVVAGVL
jgi:hypothetical protein